VQCISGCFIMTVASEIAATGWTEIPRLQTP